MVIYRFGDEVAEEEMMEQALEQKLLDAAARYAAARADLSTAIAQEPVTAAGLAAMKWQIAERQARQEQVVHLAIELDTFITSSEGTAAMKLLRESGRCIAIVEDGRKDLLHDEHSYGLGPDGFRRTAVGLWSDKERSRPIAPLDVARVIIASGRDPETVMAWLRSKLIEIADEAPKL